MNNLVEKLRLAARPDPGHRADPLRLRLAVALVATVVAVAGCGATKGPEAEKLPTDLNVILITIDTLRVDHVGAYGDRADTPALDRLAAEGIVFERCIAQTPLTLPSHTSILSGTYPTHHGVRDNGGFMVPGELELISESLQRRGYATAAFIGAYVLHSKWGLNQGFDHYSDAFERDRFQRLLLQNSKRADEVVASAEAWIDQHRDRPFFSWVHLFDPHTPYDPPPPFDTAATSYRGEVEYTDQVVGGFMDFLRQRDLPKSTVIIVTSDHGEGLGDHGEREHGFFVYDSTVRVPLIVRSPVGAAGRRWTGLVELIDLAPTILDGLGIGVPEAVQGRSLWPVVVGEDLPEKPWAYSETFYPRLHYGWSELRAFYHRDLKLIEAPRPELFDLREDENEGSNLAVDASWSDTLETVRAEYHRIEPLLSLDSHRPAAAAVTREDMAALQALGYVTTTVSADPSKPLADPKDKIAVFTRLADAAGYLAENRLAEAAAIAEEAINEDPELVDAYVLLGDAYRKSGRLEDAASHFRRALELKPDNNFAMIDLLGCLIDSGASEEAIREGTKFLGIFDDDPILHEQVGHAYASRHDHDEALHHLHRSLDLRPDDPGVLAKTGEIYLLENDLDRAEDRLRRALAVAPETRNAWYLLGRIADARGRSEEALAAFQREVTHHPGASMAAFNAALILAEKGQRDEALRYCRLAIASDPPFGLPYFMIAADHLARGTDFAEAIELCRTGIRRAPEDKNLLIGYEILLQLLQKTGDRVGYEHTLTEADELRRRIESTQ